MPRYGTFKYGTGRYGVSNPLTGSSTSSSSAVATATVRIRAHGSSASASIVSARPSVAIAAHGSASAASRAANAIPHYNAALSGLSISASSAQGTEVVNGQDLMTGSSRSVSDAIAFPRLSLAITASAYAHEVLSDGPVAYWRMNDSDTTIRDYLRRHDGYTVGAVATGVPGDLTDGDTAMTFGGSGIYGEIDNFPAIDANQNGYRASVLDLGPLAYWRLGDSGTTTADSSGNGYTGTLSASGVTTGQSAVIADGDPSMLFDGVAGNIVSAWLPRITDEWTVGCWFKIPSAPPNWSVLFDTANDSNLGIPGPGQSTTPGSTLEWWRGPYGTALCAFVPVVDNLWHKVDIKFDGTTEKIYVDGVLVGQRDIPDNNGDIGDLGNGPFTIGSTYSRGLYLPGYLDEVVVYDHVLTDEQIADQYSKALSNYSIECLLKLDTLTSTYNAVIDMPPSGAGRLLVTDLSYPAGQQGFLQFYGGMGTGGQDVSTSTPINDGKWRHVAATVSNGKLATLYVDGEPVSTRTDLIWPALTAGSVMFTRLWGWSDQPATLDEVAVYDYTLSPAQVLRHHLARHSGSAGAYSEAEALPTLGIPIHGSAESASDAISTPSVHIKNWVHSNSRSLALATPKPQLIYGPYAAAIVRSRPIAYYRLDDIGGTVAIDALGGHNGTLSGGVTEDVPGVVIDGDTAMTFDGSTGAIKADNFPQISGAYTLECWFNVPAQTSVYQALLDTPNDSNLTISPTGAVVPGSSIEWWLSGPTTPLYTSIPIAGNGWHQVAVKNDGVTEALFVDGRRVAERAASFSDLGGPGIFGIGATGTPRIYTQGAVDEVAVYDYALDDDDIMHHYCVALGLGEPVSGPTHALVVPALQTVKLGNSKTGVIFPPSKTRVTVLPSKTGAAVTSGDQ